MTVELSRTAVVRLVFYSERPSRDIEESLKEGITKLVSELGLRAGRIEVIVPLSW